MFSRVKGENNGGFVMEEGKTLFVISIGKLASIAVGKGHHIV